MKWSDSAKNTMLDAVAPAFGSLHTAYSATGLNEVAGGAPAYARKALTWSAAATGAKVLAATLPVWDIPAATDVAWMGFWTLVTGGTFLGMGPNGGETARRFVVPTGDLAADLLESPAHGYVNGDTVVLWAPSGGPAGLVVGTIYYVVSAGTDTLKLSLTLGGSAIDVTAIGSGFLQKILVQHFAGQGTLTVSSLTLNLGTLA